MKKKLIFIIFVLLISGLFLSINGIAKNNKINGEVYDKIKNSEGSRVIIKYLDGGKEINSLNNKDNKETKIVNSEDIEKIISDSNVASVELVPERKIFLQDSVPLINATNVYPLQVNGINLTGIGESVCILDTGINYTHPNLGGGFGSGYKVISGWDFCSDNGLCNPGVEDSLPEDVEGHGTHVAGIVAANGSIRGVAPDANIVSIKVCNSTGSCFDDLIRAGIDWCVGNASLYNISVISMSLGGGLYSDYCDYQDDPYNITLAINNAIAKNISVTIATGNDGSLTRISSPACIENATRVGATTKADAIASYSNRWTKDMIIAPGSSINSTYPGGYATGSGTSMATPHVAGAIALIRQYLDKSGNTKTTLEIENAFNNTGRVIYSSTRNYSRIDVYDALISLDNDSPNVNLIAPLNGVTPLSSNQTFRCNATDLSLKNMTFYLWNSSSVYNSSYSSLSGNENSFEINISNIPPGNYSWNCYYYDKNNNLGLSATNRTYFGGTRKQFILIGLDGVEMNHFNSMLASGNLSNITRLIIGKGWNGTANITGHADTSTAPGNAELLTGLNETLNNVSSNSPVTIIPDGKTVFERLKAYDSNIVTGFVFGKTTAYIPNGILANALPEIDWKHNKTTFNNSDWPLDSGTTIAYSENVSLKAEEFISANANNSFFLEVYFGTPDGTGHLYGENSSEYEQALINVDKGVGIIFDYLNSSNLLDNVQILISGDHGWNINGTGHSASVNTRRIPLVVRDVALVNNDSDGTRRQCDVTPTILDYFGVSSDNYTDIIGNGCDSMLGESNSPLIELNGPENISYSSLPIFVNLTLDELGNSCNFSIDDWATNYTLNSSNNLTYNYSLSDISEGDYIMNFYCSDLYGNVNSSYSLGFGYHLPVQNTGCSGGGGGGGGGGSGSSVYSADNTQLSLGYNKEVKKNDAVRFSLGNSSHNVTITDVTNNTVDMIVRSNVFQLTLLVGEEKKITLDSSDRYDLLVRLNSIISGKANLTIKQIDETIYENTEKNQTVNMSNRGDKKIFDEEIKTNSYLPLIVILVLLLVVLIIVYLFVKSRKNNRHKHYRSK